VGALQRELAQPRLRRHARLSAAVRFAPLGLRQLALRAPIPAAAAAALCLPAPVIAVSVPVPVAVPISVSVSVPVSVSVSVSVSVPVSVSVSVPPLAAITVFFGVAVANIATLPLRVLALDSAKLRHHATGELHVRHSGTAPAAAPKRFSCGRLGLEELQNCTVVRRILLIEPEHGAARCHESGDARVVRHRSAASGHAPANRASKVAN